MRETIAQRGTRRPTRLFVQPDTELSGHLIPDMGSFPNIVFPIRIFKQPNKKKPQLSECSGGFCSFLVALGSSVGHHCGALASAPCS